MVVLAVVVFGYTLDYGQHSEALFRVQHRSLWWNLDAPSGEQAVTLPWTCLDVSKKKDLRQFWHSHQLQQRLTCPE